MSREAVVIDFAETLARVRREGTPKANDPTAERTLCVQCGKRFVRSRSSSKTTCPACAKRRQIDAGLSTITKSGPIYEKVVRGQLRYWLAEADRLGIETPDPAA